MIDRLPYTFDDGGRAEAGFKGETRDCVVRSIAIVTRRPYKKVYDELNDYAALTEERVTGRSSSARTGIRAETIRDYLTLQSMSWHSTMSIGSGCRTHLRRGEIPERGRVIVRVSKHLSAVVDGIIRDTHDPSREGTRCVYGYWLLRA